MHLPNVVILSLAYISVAAAAPFWAFFEQTPLTAYLPATISSTIKSAYEYLYFIEFVQMTDLPLFSLKKADIIPDVLNTDFKPSLSLILSYPSHHDHVFLGNVLPPSNVTSKPVFEVHTISPNPTPTQKNTTYTLVLSDPDATSRAEPVKAQMCHWIVSGLKLQPLDSSDTFILDTTEAGMQRSSGLTELMSYVPPTPPPKTGYHRYVFVLLAPPDSTDGGKKLQKPKDRPHWGYGKVGAGVKEWAKDNGLVAVGANFFYSQNEEQ